MRRFSGFLIVGALVAVLIVLSVKHGYSEELPLYRVPCEINKIRQPSSCTCWAATTAMLLNWKAQKSQTIAEVLDPIGAGTWRVKFEADHCITEDEESAFLGEAGLDRKFPQNPTISGLYQMLKKHGPIIVTTKEGVNGNFVHARLLIEIVGDGTPQGTTLAFVDPADGKEHSENFAAFVKKYESASGYNIQIVHLPGTVEKPCD